MKTNKDSTGKKDWQKADVRVLGQILAAQNIDFVLPDFSHIAEFFAETLITIPGIAFCRVCLEGVSVQRGEIGSETCEECQAFQKRAAGQGEKAPFLLDSDFKCRLGEQPGMHLNAVASLHHHFGFFIFRVSDPDVFDVYKPFISNLANYVALSLENRLQRDLLQKSQAELQRKVEERTQELTRANTQLQKEFEIKQRAEETLQHEQMLLSRIMETSPVGITLVDHVGQITFANFQAEKVLGLTKDKITQRTYNAPDWNITTYDGDPFPNEELPFQRVMTTGQSVHDAQHMIAWPDGHRIFLSINGAPILNEAGNVDSIVFTIENITERRQAEDALKERERHSQSLLRLSRKLERAQTYDDVLNAAQDEVRDIMGYQNLWAYLFTPDKEQAKVLHAKGPMSNMVMSEEGTATITIKGDRMMEEFLETKEIQVVEDALTDERTDKKIATKMGNRTLVHVPILLFDRLMGSVGMGTFWDEGVLVPTVSEREYLMALASHMAVTLDRIYQLDKRKQMEEKLIEQEREFRTLAENSPDNIARYDVNYRTLYVNPTLEKPLDALRPKCSARPLWKQPSSRRPRNIRKRLPRYSKQEMGTRWTSYCRTGERECAITIYVSSPSEGRTARLLGFRP
jgi:PAS domain S-box-containing protein